MAHDLEDDEEEECLNANLAIVFVLDMNVMAILADYEHGFVVFAMDDDLQMGKIIRIGIRMSRDKFKVL